MTVNEEEARDLVGGATVAQLKKFAQAMDRLNQVDIIDGFKEYFDARFAYDLDRIFDTGVYCANTFEIGALSARARVVCRGMAAKTLLGLNGKVHQRQSVKGMRVELEQVEAKIRALRNRLTQNQGAMAHPSMDPQGTMYRQLQGEVSSLKSSLRVLQEERNRLREMLTCSEGAAVI